MLAINYPRAYNNPGGHGAWIVDQARRPARSAKISVIPDAQGGLFSLDGVTEFPLFMTVDTEGACVPKVDQQIIDTLKSQIADGFNALRVGSFTNRYWTESGSNWGVWSYAESDASYVNRWQMEEAALVQLDKTIAWALDLGMECIWLDLEGYDDIVNRHPNQRPQGTYQGRGMCWSSEYDQMAWDVNSRIFTRTSTITGIRHCDNGRIIWNFSNENGFSDAYQRTTTSAWGGGGSVRWFSKIIDSVTDTYGDNGYWRTELAAKWQAYIAAYLPSYTPPGGWNGCIPTPSVFSALAVGSADRNAVLDFCDQMDVDHNERVIAYARAYRSDVVLCTGTWTYTSPRAHCGLSSATMAAGNLFADTHVYFPDDTSYGVKAGSVVTRRSAFNSAWAFVTNGIDLQRMLGQRTTRTAYMASEEGQYGPSGWRYERPAIAALMACRHRHPIGMVGWAQQVTVEQLLCDGRGQQGDHANVASQCDRLMTRCVAPIVRHRFFSPVAGLFTIAATKDSVLTYQHAAGQNGFMTAQLNAASGYDGSEHGAWADKAVVFDLADGNTPTSVWTAYPKVLDATMASGTYVINTASEKIHVRHNHGVQAMSPYVCWWINEVLASPVFAMPLSVSNLAAAITQANVCLRSDGPWPLFTGPMGLFILGSDYTLDLVNRSAAYAPTGGIGEASWLANTDQRTLYYTASNSQSWSNGGVSDQRLMMPETFTVSMDTSGAPGAFAGVELEVFKVDKDGLPARVATSFASGITSFAYDATCPYYRVQPAAARTTSVRSARAGGSLAPSGGEQGLDFSSPDNSGYLSLHSIGV